MLKNIGLRLALILIALLLSVTVYKHLEIKYETPQLTQVCIGKCGEITVSCNLPSVRVALIVMNIVWTLFAMFSPFKQQPSFNYSSITMYRF